MPTRRENETQLERILASKTFEEAPSLVSLLKTLVECELAGKPIDERTLGVELFNKPKDWNPMEETAVRQSLANLRKRLSDYYEEEGSGDPVFISFPKRRGYRPTFRHNEGSTPLVHYRRGIERFQGTFPEILYKSSLPVVREFEASIKANPSYAQAYAALAEVLLIYSMCDEPYYFSPRERIPQAEQAARTALKLDERQWLAHIVLGAIHCCHFRWQAAENAFDAALRIAPEETRAHFWYAAFLIAVGRTEEGKTCIGNVLGTAPVSKFKPVIKSLFLYVTRDFDQAYQTLMQTGTEWSFVEDWWQYSIGNEPLLCDNWLVEALMSCICLSMGYGSAWRYAKAAGEHSKVGSFSGLLVLSFGVRAGLGHAEFGERALNLFAKMEEKPEHVGALSMALACVGVNKKGDAIAYLRQACDEANPFMTWLHLWPVFDPIRDHRGFKKLIKRMNLPG